MIVMVDTRTCTISRRAPAAHAPPVGTRACNHFYMMQGGSPPLFDGEQQSQAHGTVHSSYIQSLPR